MNNAMDVACGPMSSQPMGKLNMTESIPNGANHDENWLYRTHSTAQAKDDKKCQELLWFYFLAG